MRNPGPGQRQDKKRRDERDAKTSGAGRGKPAAPKVRRARPQAEVGGSPVGPLRIAKARAGAGLCSPRDPERWILEGRRSVTGQSLKTPASDVTRSDTVKVDRRPL